MILTLANRAIQLLLILALLIGLLGTFMPAFSYLPALGGHHLSLSAWQALYQSPGLLNSLKLTLISGIGATVISVLLATSSIAYFYQSQWLKYIRASLAPILAIPHTAIAIGLLFLLSPSGWIARIFSPWLTGFERPPNWTTVQDPFSFSLILGLVIKETPYLLFVILAALKQLEVERVITLGRTMGYSPITTWRKILLPALYPLIRLPIFIVLTFSLTVVDLALIIGPNTPSTFAVTLFHWFQDADLTLRFNASAGAILLMLIAALSCLGWELVYKLIDASQKAWRINGKRTLTSRYLITASSYLYLFTLLFAVLCIAVLLLWSVTRRWRFPDALPSQWSFANIQGSFDLLLNLSANTLIIAGSSALISLLLSVVILEHKRIQQPASELFSPILFERLLYIPMLLPQVGFLFGLQIALIWSGYTGSFASIISLHVLYVLPYVYLTLNGPYLNFQQNYYVQAVALTRRPVKAFVLVKLAMLKAALFSAFAIGVAVSIAQYLPTLVAAQGRIDTLTTEAVALAASADRKKLSLMALLQALFPFIIFSLALLLPKVWTNWRVALKSLLTSNRK